MSCQSPETGYRDELEDLEECSCEPDKRCPKCERALRRYRALGCATGWGAEGNQ